MNLDFLPRLAGTILPGVISRRASEAVYLTFDDGPDPATTPQVLDILDRYNAKATFFVTGKAAVAFPDLVRKTVDRGHTVGTHGYLHTSMRGYSDRVVTESLKLAVERLEAVTYRDVDYFRPPYGRFNLWVLVSARRLGMKLTLWAVSLSDWESPPPEKLIERFRKRARPGYIVLLHDAGRGAGNLIEALPGILEHLRDKGWRAEEM